MGFEQLVKILKQIGLFSLVLGALLVLGASINVFLPWNWLTSFFVIIRHVSMSFNFIIDIPTMWIIVGLCILLESLIWAFFAVQYVVNFFKR